MKSVISILLILSAISFNLLAAGDNGNKNKKNDDPLQTLSSEQRKHYEAYIELENLFKQATFDYKKAVEDTFSSVRKWCENAKNVYHNAGLKNAEKAQKTERSEQKKVYEEQSNIYFSLSESCENILKKIQANSIPQTMKELDSLEVFENEARQLNLKLLKREWLTLREFRRIYRATLAYQAQRQKKGDAQASENGDSVSKKTPKTRQQSKKQSSKK